jgi:hypothetical protein
MAKLAAPRANHLAAIHISEKALGMSRDDAAVLKLQITGHPSSKDMTAQQRARYLAHLAGLQGPRPAPSAPRPPAARKTRKMTAGSKPAPCGTPWQRRAWCTPTPTPR